MRIREWPDGTVAYHEATATTHLLDPLAGAVLSRLADLARDGRHAGADLQQLAEALARQSPGLAPDNPAPMLDTTLQRLAQVGLVVALDP